ncbi:MAG: hypothetical protein LBV04_06030 [Deferribacteraceae bacterium]|jgi:epoxyqueuosine reductase QueG|nr:hypothetical protein [Deferribacteraceae bacterium]
MRQGIEQALVSFIDDYCHNNNVANMWQQPLVRYASVDNPIIRQLKTLVHPEHRMPEDFLPAAKSIISYYLPFKENIGKSNIGGELASPEWAKAYATTNKMAAQLNLQLVDYIKAHGFDAASSGNPGRIAKDIHFSNWSQRHVAYAAGHGSFGLNNMLITERGCCGRFFSVITSLPFADEEYQGERCLYKSKGACKLCMAACPVGALTTEGFDRLKCSIMGDKSAAIYNGDTICGKCVAGMPYAYRG